MLQRAARACARLSQTAPRAACPLRPPVRALANTAAEDRAAFRSPRRKATALLTELRAEEPERRRYEIPSFRAGDAIEMDVNLDVDSKRPQKVRGLVIAKSNNGADSTVTLFCDVRGTHVTRIIPLYSPLVKAVRVIQKAFLTKGKKKVKRAKLYYLIDQKKSFKAP